MAIAKGLLKLVKGLKGRKAKCKTKNGEGPPDN
jgi:hypothetical protein